MLVAERTGRNVAELLATTTVGELRRWYALIALEQEEQQRAIDAARR